MHDKDLIEKICNLTCDKNDVYRNQTTINYDCRTYCCGYSTV